MSLLKKSFYTRTDVLKVSKELLGKFLVTNFAGQYTAGMIVETEAYRAPDDKACHAYNDRRTPRTEVMFHEGGVSYVYTIYGMYDLFNVVSAKKDMAHAVLIRGLEPTDGLDIMQKRRKGMDIKPLLTAGPGRLGMALGIKKAHSCVSLMDKKGGIWIEDRGVKVKEKEIISGPRVGMSTAEECSNWPWRFRILNNKWTSKPDHVEYDI